MDKKKVIKWTAGILVNLAALVGIFLTANPQILATKTKQDSLNEVAAARFVPSYRKSANPGMLTRTANEVNEQIAEDQRRREMRERKMTREDTITNRSKMSIHLRQQKYFEDEFTAFKKEMQIVDPKTTFGTKTYNENDWDILNGTRPGTAYTGDYELKPDIQVYGFHPYWMGSAYKCYNYGLLSTVAYYGAEIDPSTGYITNKHGWETTALPKMAGDTELIQPCRVELAVINIGEENNRTFLSVEWSRQTLIDSLRALLRKRGDGICLDFENVPLTMRDSLTLFVTALHDSLQADVKGKIDTTMNGFFRGYSITMILPCFDWTGAYDVKKLAEVVDRFVVTGYDYYGSSNTNTGPVAPLSSGLKWNAPNIESSVKNYVDKGIPKPKLLLGLPYYGTYWKTVNVKVPTENARFIGFKFYRDLRNEMALKRIDYDTTSVSAYYATNDPVPVQFWFDNKETLSEKYRWVQRNRLGGVGIWALGYDNGYPDLWQSLRENFGANWLSEDTTYRTKFPVMAHDTLPLPQDKEWGIVAANGHYLIFDNPYVLLYGAMALFALILLLQVILDQQPFNELWSKRLLLFVLSSLAGTAAIIFLGLALWSKVPHREVYLLLAGIIGGYLLFRLTQRIVGKRERLP
jgi:spore germination protein YaaH